MPPDVSAAGVMSILSAIVYVPAESETFPCRSEVPVTVRLDRVVAPRF